MKIVFGQYHLRIQVKDNTLMEGNGISKAFNQTKEIVQILII